MDNVGKLLIPQNCSGNIQLLVAFLIGLLTSPWSFGFVYFITFIIIYEIILAFVYSQCTEDYIYTLELRFGIIIVSILGFLFGRILVGFSNPFQQKIK